MIPLLSSTFTLPGTKSVAGGISISSCSVTRMVSPLCLARAWASARVFPRYALSAAYSLALGERFWVFSIWGAVFCGAVVVLDFWRGVCAAVLTVGAVALACWAAAWLSRFYPSISTTIINPFLSSALILPGTKSVAGGISISSCSVTRMVSPLCLARVWASARVFPR